MDKFVVADNIARLVRDVSESSDGYYKVTVIIEPPNGKQLTPKTVRSIFEKARHEIRNPPHIDFKR